MNTKPSDAKRTETTRIFSWSAAGWLIAVLLAMATVAPARYFGLSNLLAAHLSMGIFGLTGGLSHGRLVRVVGGGISLKQSAVLSVLWAAACIAGVTPLFFIFGSPIKMSLLAFYSFGVFAAAGGWITGEMVCSALGRTRKGRVRYVLAWALSFGFAALAVNPASAVLKLFLPPGPALFLSIGIMALIVGSGAGYSLLMVAASPEAGPPPPESTRFEPADIHDEKASNLIPVLMLLAAPFYLNDLSNIFITDWRLWLLIDVIATKLFPIVLTIRLIRTGIIRSDPLGLTSQSPIPFLVVFLVGTLAGSLILANGPLIIGRLPGYPRLGSIPLIQSAPWKWMDLTLGLLLVGVCEELVFRGYLRAVFTRYGTSAVVMVFLSSLMFGLAHWSDGFHQVLITGVIGALFMVLYMASGSLPAIMLSHFAVNFIHYAEFIPESLFRFF